MRKDDKYNKIWENNRIPLELYTDVLKMGNESISNIINTLLERQISIYNKNGKSRIPKEFNYKKPSRTKTKSFRMRRSIRKEINEICEKEFRTAALQIDYFLAIEVFLYKNKTQKK